MASHGVTRTTGPRTEEQRKQDLEKIRKYQELDEQVRVQVAQGNYNSELFHLTSKLVRLNPEYYTIWNVRRRCLISGLLSRPSPGSWPSKASPSSSPSDTIPSSSAAYSSSSSAAIPPPPQSPRTGESGTTADENRQEHEAADGNAESGAIEAERRKQANVAKDLEILQNELQFTIPLLMSFPKCYWLWNYRLFILQQSILLLPKPIARQIWEEELALDSKMLSRDKRNFHAWGYRRKIVTKLESSELNGSSMVEPEFAYTKRMIEGDLSNFSAWHNRSKLIHRLLDERKADARARKALLEEELDMLREAYNVDPGDQSIWFYHQFLVISNLIDPNGQVPGLAPGLTAKERVAYVAREVEEIKDLLQDYVDFKWIYEALVNYVPAIAQLEGRDINGAEKKDVQTWLDKLRELDPMRKGRWNDISGQVCLTT